MRGPEGDQGEQRQRTAHEERVLERVARTTRPTATFGSDEATDGPVHLGVVALDRVAFGVHLEGGEGQVLGGQDLAREVSIDDGQGHVFQVDEGGLGQRLAVGLQRLVVQGVELRSAESPAARRCRAAPSRAPRARG